MFDYVLVFERGTGGRSEVQHYEIFFQEKNDVSALLHAVQTAEKHCNGWPLFNLLLTRGDEVLCKV
jgi:hypothetical protein